MKAWNRHRPRPILRRLIALGMGLLTLHGSSTRGGESVPPGLDAAVSRGLDFLVTQQNADGSFGAAQKPELTGLALCDFLSAGHTPDVGRYGSPVRSAIDFLLSAARPDGSFDDGERPMRGQAIATIALAEAYGVETSEDYRRRMATILSNSVRLILRAQDVKKPPDLAGGWRYTADAADSDLLLTGWTALALRAAQDVGIDIPRPNIQRAVQFILRCYDAKLKGFGFQPYQAAIPNCTGVGVVSLHLLDPRNTARYREGPDVYRYLAGNPVDDTSPYFYAGVYFSTYAALEAGDPTWSTIKNADSARLLKLQEKDGGWPATAEGSGRAYTTGMALLTQTVQFRLLPLYQR